MGRDKLLSRATRVRACNRKLRYRASIGSTAASESVSESESESSAAAEPAPAPPELPPNRLATMARMPLSSSASASPSARFSTSASSRSGSAWAASENRAAGGGWIFQCCPSFGSPSQCRGLRSSRSYGGAGSNHPASALASAAAAAAASAASAAAARPCGAAAFLPFARTRHGCG